MAGVGFERIEPMLPACWLEAEEHAVRARKAPARRMVAAALVGLFI